MSFEIQDIERKVISILKILEDSREPLGARIIAQRLREYGIELGERAVRYHLKLMDERGLTRLVGRHDGRLLTEQGAEEVKSALVRDKVGLVISRIEVLAFRTNFNLEKRSGLVPVNISFFPEEKFSQALKAMKPVFEKGLCVSDLVAVAHQGEKLGGLIVPQGKIGMATICSIIINGALLRAGICIDSKFAGILQIKEYMPLRFVELIQYAGSSLDPSAIFITSKMTSVGQVAREGKGRILANFREIPVLCKPAAEEVITGLKAAGMGGLIMMGEVGKPTCEIPAEVNKIGMILVGGLNPTAAAEEDGITTENHAMSTIMDYQDLTKFKESSFCVLV